MLEPEHPTMDFRFARAKLRLFAIVLLFVLFPITVHAVDIAQNRKSVIHQMAQDFSRLGLHKLYVPDFCDGSSHSNGLSSFFAFIFSDMLKK
jgi:hypothetical protein